MHYDYFMNLVQNINNFKLFIYEQNLKNFEQFYFLNINKFYIIIHLLN